MELVLLAVACVYLLFPRARGGGVSPDAIAAEQRANREFGWFLLVVSVAIAAWAAWRWW